MNLLLSSSNKIYLNFCSVSNISVKSNWNKKKIIQEKWINNHKKGVKKLNKLLSCIVPFNIIISVQYHTFFSHKLNIYISSSSLRDSQALSVYKWYIITIGRTRQVYWNKQIRKKLKKNSFYRCRRYYKYIYNLVILINRKKKERINIKVKLSSKKDK
jgi:hypothetical protein